MLNKKTISILQISLMVIAIFAFAFILEGAFVSAEDPSDGTPTTETTGTSEPQEVEKTGALCETSGGYCASYCGDNGRLSSNYDCPLGTSCCDASSQNQQQSSSEQSSNNNPSGSTFERISIPIISGVATPVITGWIKPGAEAAATTTTTATASSTAGSGAGGSAAGSSAGSAGASSGSFLFGTVGGSILSIAVISVAAGLLARYLAPEFGASISQAQSLGWIAASAGGVGTAAGIAFGSAFSGSMFTSGFISGVTVGFGAGILVAAILMVAFYKKEPVEIVQFQCLAWQPQRGGDYCEECNDGNLPCTEYQCKSLGSGCEIVNKGTEDEMCSFANRTDVKAPIIAVNRAEYDPDEIALLPYADSNFPEDRGVKMTVKDKDTGCFSPFEEIDIAITLDEIGICKYSFFRDNSYDEMPPVYFSNGLGGYNHSTSFNLPGRDNIESENLTFFEGLNNIYIRCEDYHNGNQNIANYVFDFCIDETPDLTEPVILETNPQTESYLPFDTSEVETTFFIDKPADCRWDHFDMAYEDMQNSMSCTSSVGDGTTLNQRMVYPCTTTLTGIQNYESNDFFISCKSYPEKEEVERMEMGQAYKYTLIGTRPLGISSISPNDTTIVDSAEVIKVNLEAETIEGALEDGTAVCQYSMSGNDNDLVAFFDTNSYQHSQELFLEEGNYNIRIKCTDVGGNIVEEYARFTIDTDTEPPIVARAYYENNKIVLITTENSTCTYNTNSCEQSYVDSVEITTSNNIEHYLAWDTKQDLYIKCQDIYENRPGPGVCNMIVRGHEIYSVQEQ